MRRIARTDPITRIPLLSIKHEGKNPEPILPLESEDVEVLRNSPLMQIVNPEDDLDEMASSLMGPGPWTFHRDLNLPASCDQMKFTNRNRRGNIVITHTLKLVMRVERGDDLHMDKSGKRKLFDIVVQTPVLILSVGLSCPYCHTADSHCILFSVVAIQNGLHFLDIPRYSRTQLPPSHLAAHVKLPANKANIPRAFVVLLSALRRDTPPILLRQLQRQAPFTRRCARSVRATIAIQFYAQILYSSA